MTHFIIQKFKENYRKILKNNDYGLREDVHGFAIRNRNDGKIWRVYEEDEKLSTILKERTNHSLCVMNVSSFYKGELTTIETLTLTKGKQGVIEMTVFSFDAQKVELQCRELMFDRFGYEYCDDRCDEKTRKEVQNTYIDYLKETNEYRLFEATGSLTITHV